MERHLVFDVGLNVGQDTAFYLAQGHRVVAVEADPTLAAAARERFRPDIEAENLEIVNAGIAAREGVAEFWISEGRSNFNSFHKEIAARDGYPSHSIQVPTVRFALLLDRFGTPYFLKIDIEGNDMLCLADLSSSSLPRFISVESECPTRDGAGGPEDGLRVLRTLRDLGYRRFKLIDQLTFCSLAVPRSLNQILDSLGRQVLSAPPWNRLRGACRASRHLIVKSRLESRFGREFPVGSSGVWGDDTPGRWLTYEQAGGAYQHYRAKHFQAPTARHYSFWCDWHATF